MLQGIETVLCNIPGLLLGVVRYVLQSDLLNVWAQRFHLGFRRRHRQILYEQRPFRSRF